MVENETVPLLGRGGEPKDAVRSNKFPMRDHRLLLLSRPESKNIDSWRLSTIRSPPLNAEPP
jgi:hypothetical protein